MLGTIPAFEIALLATPRDHRAIVAGYREEFPTGRGDRSPDPEGINGYAVLIQRYAGGSHVPVELAGLDDVWVCGCLPYPQKPAWPPMAVRTSITSRSSG